MPRHGVAGIALAVLLVLTSCGGNGGGEAGAEAGGAYAQLSGELKGSGASFPDAYYQEVIGAFREVAPNVTVTYNATGSGTGKSEFGEGLTDFAGTDSLVDEDDGITEDFCYIPTVAAPITVAYHLDGVDTLRLSPDTLAGIFQGDITAWNAPAIAADNPGTQLPDTTITVVHRSDASGTTSNFTSYLDKASEVWRLGSGDTVEWPAGSQGGAKNTGVAQIVKATPGAIGYVDLSDAKASGLSFAAIRNRDGNYVTPTLDGATAALDGAEVADDLSYDPLNAAGAKAYPITAPTYLLVRARYADPEKAELVKAFVEFLLTDGQDLAPEVDFAPLPDSLREAALTQLDTIHG